jgi:hypothetical protein
MNATTTLTPLQAAPARRRRWPWALALTALVLIVLAAAAAVVLAGFIDGAGSGFNVVIDDDSFQILPTGIEAGWSLVLGLTLAILVVVLVVPRWWWCWWRWWWSRCSAWWR